MRLKIVRESEEDFSSRNPEEFLLLSCETLRWRQSFFFFPDDANLWHTLSHTHRHTHWDSLRRTTAVIVGTQCQLCLPWELTAATRHETPPRPRPLCLLMTKDLFLSYGGLIEYDNLGVTVVYPAALLSALPRSEIQKDLMSFVRWIKHCFFGKCCINTNKVFKDTWHIIKATFALH